MNVLDLFSGIGGFSLGLERAGMRTVAFCEIDPFCRRVLKKHWPHVPCYEDIRELTADRLRADGITVDLICGGFPCQDISLAGKGAGIEGSRSGLWSEFARLICELRPDYVIVENVAALLGQGLCRVVGDLASIGYNSEWHCIPASYVGAPHRRDRIWIVAHPDSKRLEGWIGQRLLKCTGEWIIGQGGSSMENPTGGGWNAQSLSGTGPQARDSSTNADSSSSTDRGSAWWSIEPDVGRVAHGIPKRMDRLTALGNAVVPQIPEIIGRAIMASIYR